MKTASITEAKNNLSALIDGLEDGSPVLIADRGRPVARLEAALESDDGADAGRIARLVREGLARPARGALPLSFLAERPPRADPGESAVDMVIAERRESR
ncbi:prevent-host-death family protein [Roseiarcus fermentans]|uniref:Antitoxin n=1 Tax=Roseiarcus fermentans TaxID=1473586 RepID=A0A366EQ71_9HYPH|nr:type II toxin-antitoxin system Phd/YefM family antitoxin [Roseiarcus fermentans]RBP04563.1 prevent-host-death family protein [Roseiarcus fermentans]